MKQEITKVVCDCNIWYNFANENINLTDLKNIDLIGTAVNIFELASSPNIISNPKLLQTAIKKFIENNYDIIKLNPFEFIAFNFDNEFITETRMIDRQLHNFEILIPLNIENDIHKIEINDTKKEINVLQSRKTKEASKLNEILELIKNEIKQTHLKKEHRKKNFRPIWINTFSKSIEKYIKLNYNKDISISPNSEKWNNFNVFLEAWEEYFKKLEIEPSKYDKNDWEDLINLIYVLPDYKYWTFENKWIRLFKNNKFLKNYLFQIK